MPSFANPPQIKKAPRTDANGAGPISHPDKSISPPKLRTLDRAGKRQETAHQFWEHAEQVRRQKESELKRRQREKHEAEMRKGEAQRKAQAARAPESPFQLMSQVRHENYQKKMEEKLRQQQAVEKKAAAFQARQFRPTPPPDQK